MSDTSLLAELQAENARLIALLEKHGIDWQLPVVPMQVSPERIHISGSPALDTDGKLALLRSLFRGRTDIYPLRWESKNGNCGYAPACANEWRPGVCEKPRIKCGHCTQRQLLPVTDELIYKHLAGALVAGVYPLLTDDTCYFLAADFDEAEWRDDATAFVQSCRALDVPVALEISRSGNGAHAWIFFQQPVPASDARRLGAAIISHACERTRQLALSSYDRLFPNQDYMPKGGFGNLIALPLQKHARANNHSVFVDDSLQPWSDQWAFLASIERLAPERIQAAITQAIGHRDPVTVAYLDDDTNTQPWKAERTASRALDCPLPKQLDITLANMIYFEKSQLPQPLANQLILDCALRQEVANLFTLHGRIPKKQRTSLISELEALSPEAPRVLLATGTLIGEGFDHPPLDTLVLAMPISWRGMLQQYAGRLHRSHTSKADVYVIDFVDEGHAALMRMWEKRKAGYRAMGYRLEDAGQTLALL